MQRQLKSIPVKASGFGEPQEVHLDVNLENNLQSLASVFSLFKSHVFRASHVFLCFFSSRVVLIFIIYNIYSNLFFWR